MEERRSYVGGSVDCDLSLFLSAAAAAAAGAVRRLYPYPSGETNARESKPISKIHNHVAAAAAARADKRIMIFRFGERGDGALTH